MVLQRMTKALSKRITQFLQQPKTTILRQSYPYILMALVPMFILWATLIQRGFIFRLDMVFSPFVYYKFDAIESGFALYHTLGRDTLLHSINFFLPMDIAQKLILFGIFFGSIFSTYTVIKVPSNLARLTAGLLYAVNPYTYDRLLAGHWWFLIGYSLAPFMIGAMERFFVKPDRHHALRVIVWWSVVTLFSIHHLILGAIVFLVFAAIYVRSKKALYWALATIAGVCALHIWWLIPHIFGSHSAQIVGTEHFFAFASKTDLQQGIWFTLLSLQGFWFTDWSDLKDTYSQWAILFVMWLTPVFAGFGAWASYSRKQVRIFSAYLVIAGIAVVLAAGPHPPVGDLNIWLFTHVPGLSNLRESQKVLSLLVYVYALLAAFGLNFFLQNMRKTGVLLMVVSLAMISIIGRPLWFAADGQLTTITYPESWHQFRTTLQNDASDSRAIVLPWDLYTDNTFTNVLHANPAWAFFGPRILQSQQTNISGIIDTAQLETVDIETAVALEDPSLLTSAMKRHNARYILVTQSGTKDKYNWLTAHPHFDVVLTDAELVALSLTK